MIGFEAEARVGAMSITTLTSREFNQDTGRAKKAASHGPLFITDRGKPSHVLLSIEDYWRLSGHRRTIVEALSTPGLSDIDVEFPRSPELPRPVDLSWPLFRDE